MVYTSINLSKSADYEKLPISSIGLVQRFGALRSGGKSKRKVSI